MGAVVGFAVGYLLGTQAGREGLEELVASWKVISESDEVRDLVAGGMAAARDLVAHGRGALAERIQPERARLHRVA